MPGQEDTDLSLQKVAVIGLACRVPGASTAQEFWRNLLAGTESIAATWPRTADGSADAASQGGQFVDAGAWLSGVYDFDAPFFGIAPREAELMDPQQRHLLECTHELFEDAAHLPQDFGNEVGVFLGAGTNHYIINAMLARNRRIAESGATRVLTANDSPATQVSYRFGLTGPSMSLNTMCSTSLVAIHMACRSLLSYECDAAIAGGVRILVPTNRGYQFNEGGVLSPDGHCRPFDAAARGTVPGSGVGLVLLRRLEDATADRDPIRATILGSAVNNDGAEKAGYTAPGVAGQRRVVAAAYEVAGVSPTTIEFLEAHGTGTSLGDPIEVKALHAVFGKRTGGGGACALGSVKGNIGHLDVAAGVVGFQKAVLALENRAIPPTVNFESPNPLLDLRSGPFYVNAEEKSWPASAVPRRAAVSSFGIGGTNAHVVLEEFQPGAPVSGERSAQPAAASLICVSARTPSALERNVRKLGAHLEGTGSGKSIADVAFSLALGRRQLTHRAFVVSRDSGAAGGALGRLADFGDACLRQPGIALLFPGQGTQYEGMFESLYQQNDLFRASLDRCSAVLLDHLSLDIRGPLFRHSTLSWHENELFDTAYAQPVLFAVEYSLAQMWLGFGVVPSVLVGHSVGEFSAACVAGVFGLEDGLRVVAERGRLSKAAAPGSMVAVRCSQTELQKILPGDCYLSAANAPTACNVVGTVQAIRAFEESLRARNIAFAHLQVARPFHSPLLRPAASELLYTLRSIRLNEPRVPLISNITGRLLSAEEAVRPEYWASQLCEPVQFSRAVEQMGALRVNACVEVGPGDSLSSWVGRHECCTGLRTLPSGRHRRDALDDMEIVLDSVGRLWQLGVDINWKRLFGGTPARQSLPTYAFDHESYQLDTPQADAEIRQAAFVYVPAWKCMAQIGDDPGAAAMDEHWLVFCDPSQLSEQIVRFLRDAGATVSQVYQGNILSVENAAELVIRPAVEADWHSLVAAGCLARKPLRNILYLWSLLEGQTDYSRQTIQTSVAVTVHGPMALARALGGRFDTAGLRLGMVTSGAYSVTESEPVNCCSSLLRGPAVTIPQEYHYRRCIQIDIGDRRSDADPSIASSIVTQVRDDGGPTLVALRGRRCWYRANERLERVKDPPAARGLRDRGVYVLTGGLGAIGFAISRFLMETRAAVIILTSRSDPETSASRSAGLAQLRSLAASNGTELFVEVADVSDPDAMRRVLDNYEARLHRIDGVFHLAGVVSDDAFQLIARSSSFDCAPQFAAKVDGSLVLANLLQGRNVGFCVLFSSLATVLGGVGRTTYISANAFMESLAEARASVGDQPHFLSIAWDGWQLNDMPVASVQERVLKRFLSFTQAVGALELLLSQDPLHTAIVAAEELPKSASADRSAAGAGVSARQPSAARSRPTTLANVYVAPTTATEVAIVAIWEELLGFHGIGVNDHFFDLGGDSLIAVQLVLRLSGEFHVDVGVRVVLESGTVRAIANAVMALRLLGPDTGSRAAVETGEI